MAERPPRSSRRDYVRFISIDTRWEDNDVYGHVNNAVYYSFFDTAVNSILIEAGVLDLRKSDIVGLVVANSCSYFASIAFPDRIEVGVRVAHVGRSSVRYDIGVFRAGDDDAAAQGEFTHVYVVRDTQRPVEIPAAFRRVLDQLKQ